MARPPELGGKGSRFIVLASIFLIVAGLYFGREVFVPLALAILLSFLLTPPIRHLERLHVPRGAATVVAFAVAVALIGGIGYIVGKQFVVIVNELPRYEGELRHKLQTLGTHGRIFRKLSAELSSVGASVSTPQGEAAPPGALSQGGAPATKPVPVTIVEQNTPTQLMRRYATTILDPLATAGLVLVFVIFMLYNREDLRDRMIRLVGHGRVNVTTQALDEAATRISHYLGALSIVNGCYALITVGMLWVIGHYLGGGQGYHDALVCGILVGLLRFVPYVGVWIGASFPLLISFALLPGYAAFFATLGFFIAMEIVISQFIEPVWYGATTGMSALAVLVAAVFWTWLWGPIGLLLSTPLTVCLVVIGKHVPQLGFLDIMLGDEPVLPPHIRLYQRLIAGDDEEAGELAHQSLDEGALEQVYDQVLLPALAMAEEDHHAGRIDDRGHQFVRQSLRDLVEELAEEEHARRARQAASATEQRAKDQPAKPQKQEPSRALPKDCPVYVACLPAKDEADEIVAHMLRNLLVFRGYCAVAASVTSLAAEMVELIDKQPSDIVCVSALPPSAVAHARYLCKRIHARFPEMGLIVGLWTVKGDLEKARRRIACAEAVGIATTLAQAEHEIDQMAQPIIVRRTSETASTPVGAK